MKVKGEAIELGVPVINAEMIELFSHSALVDSSLEHGKLTKEDLKKVTAFQSFFLKALLLVALCISDIKCTDKSCHYCTEHPVRLPLEVFHELSFLPLPQLDHTK